MVVHLAGLAGLFAAFFLAATVFPFQSEVVLAGMVLAERAPVWLLVAVASGGNVLGSSVLREPLPVFVALAKVALSQHLCLQRSFRVRRGL